MNRYNEHLCLNMKHFMNLWFIQIIYYEIKGFWTFLNKNHISSARTQWTVCIKTRQMYSLSPLAVSIFYINKIVYNK